MRAQEVQVHTRKRPFAPFRVFLFDGSSHDVRHPEFIFIAQREIWVGTPSRAEQIPETAVYIDPVHITRIEPINGKGRGAKPRKVR